MMISPLLFGLAVVPLYVVAQGMIFDSPALNEIVNGGSTYIVRIHSSPDDPYFNQLDNFELLLFSGKYSSSEDIYSWNLTNINPATTQSKITIPSSIAPNKEHAYFMGIRGSVKSNSSVSATYFSNYFTLANMSTTEDGLTATSKDKSSSSPSEKFPLWAFIVILGTAIISLSLAWGFLCYRMKRKQTKAIRNCDYEASAAEKWYKSPTSDSKHGRIVKHNSERSALLPITHGLPILSGRPQRPARPRSTTLSGNFMFELDASEIQRPPNVWRESWHTVRGLVIGGRSEVRISRMDEDIRILPNVPIPRGATIERRNEVRWKPSYPGT